MTSQRLGLRHLLRNNKPKLYDVGPSDVFYAIHDAANTDSFQMKMNKKKSINYTEI